ncbi:MAG: hypothetical protein AAGJ70_13280 [Pseudomonadota bacterium]
MDIRDMIGWFATLMSACIIGCGLLALAMAISRSASDEPNMGAALAMIAAFTFMFPLGITAAVAGAAGLVWTPPVDTDDASTSDTDPTQARGHIWRCRSAIAIGLLATALGVTLGVPFR